jgi:hypothetical protein
MDMELGKNINYKVTNSLEDFVNRSAWHSVGASVHDSVYSLVRISAGISLWNLVGSFYNSRYGIR